MRLLKQFASRRNGCDDDAGASGARTRRHRRTQFIVTKTVVALPGREPPRLHLDGTNVTLAFRYLGKNAGEGVLYCSYA